MRQLSVYMAKHNRTKLPQRITSSLFALEARSSLDVFFSSDALTKVVRAATPIRVSGGFLTFIHKTIMEHSVAVAVMDGVETAVAASGLNPQRLIEVRMVQCSFQELGCNIVPSLPFSISRSPTSWRQSTKRMS